MRAGVRLADRVTPKGDGSGSKRGADISFILLCKLRPIPKCGKGRCPRRSHTRLGAGTDRARVLLHTHPTPSSSLKSPPARSSTCPSTCPPPTPAAIPKGSEGVWLGAGTCFLSASKAALMVCTRVRSLAFARSLRVCCRALISEEAAVKAARPFLGDAEERSGWLL